MTATTERTNSPASSGSTPGVGAHGHVIAGVIEPAGDDLLDVVAPADGRVIARVAAGTAEDVDRAVAAARAALPAWRAQTPSDRARIMNEVADIVDEHLDELARLESRNVGKPMTLAREEIPGVSEVFRFMGGAARALTSPSPEEYVEGHLSMVRREPHGVIGAITPWNYPLVTASWKVAAAIAMGNTVVLKPSELTPLTTLRFMELVADVLPAGVVNVVIGLGPVVGAAIASHPGIDMISLTGSIASGQQVMTDASKTLKPVHLELGGKAPVVIFEDADLEAVAATVKAVGFVNSGQECGAATRILCQGAVRQRLTDLLVEAVASIKVGHPEDGDDVEMGPLVSRAHQERVAGMLRRAEDEGATLVVADDDLPSDGFFQAPVVVTQAPAGAEILTHEVFGPVITIEEFGHEDDAVELANSTVYGLAASVWTQNLGRGLRLTGALDFGTVWVNQHLVVTSEMPWVGFGASGHGRESSLLSLEDFSRTKHVMINLGRS